MTEHLNLPELTSFAARYHLASQIRSGIGQSQDETLVIERITSTANNLSLNRSCGLSGNFMALRSDVEQQCATHGAHISEELAASLKSLCEVLDKHLCQECGFADQPCLHHEKTFEKVSTGGKCIEPLKQLFLDLTDWVDSLWQQLPQAASRPEIVFATTTGRTFGDSRPIIQKFAVSGYALSLGEPGKYSTKVGLEIREKAFGWEQYNLLPYVLLHEILCHAFQSLDNPPLRENADEDDAWSEGWMDSLAHSLALEWLKDHRGTPLKTPAEKEFARSQTTQLHNARYVGLSAAEITSAVPGPAYGRKVFDDVRACYPALYEKLPISQHPLVKFSLRLNAITMCKRERVPPLLAMKFLAKHDPSRLRRAIGDFIATPLTQVALDRLRSVLK
jgi:hypothetical protein